MIPVSEADFQKTVIELAQKMGWLVAHFRPARTEKGWRTPVSADGKGFPDLIMVHEQYGWIVVAEIKSETGKVTPEQDKWLKAFQACLPFDVFTWRANDDKDWEEIQNTLIPIKRQVSKR